MSSILINSSKKENAVLSGWRFFVVYPCHCEELKRRGNLNIYNCRYYHRTIHKGRSQSFAPTNKSPLQPSLRAQMWDDVYINSNYEF